MGSMTDRKPNERRSEGMGMRTIPEVSEDCIVATIETAVRVGPTQYAMAEMDRIAEEQPNVQAALASVLEMFMDGLGDEEEVPARLAKELALTATFCSLGITMSAIKAQLEGNQMEQQWGDDERS